MRIAAALLSMLLTSISAQAAPRVELKPTSQGTARLSLDNGYFPVSKVRAVQLSMTLPAAVAARFASAAKAGGVRVFTNKDMTGPEVRLVAGNGASAVIIDRIRRGDVNGQSGSGDVRIQLGVGAGARAFFVGRTHTLRQLGDGLITGSRSVRIGVSAAIDPATLAPSVPGTNPSGTWWLRPTTKLTTDVEAPLLAYGDSATRAVVNRRSTFRAVGIDLEAGAAELGRNLQQIDSQIQVHKKATRNPRRGPDPSRTKAGLLRAAGEQLGQARTALDRGRLHDAVRVASQVLFTTAGTLKKRIDPRQRQSAIEALRSSHIAWSDALIPRLKADLARVRQAYRNVPEGMRFDPKVLDELKWDDYPRFKIEARWNGRLSPQAQRLVAYAETQLVKVSLDTSSDDLMRSALEPFSYGKWEGVKRGLSGLIGGDCAQRETQISKLRQAIEAERGRAELRLARNVFGLSRLPVRMFPFSMGYALTAPVLEHD